MKKTLLGFLCLFAVMVSCDISLPQSIIIRGTPGVYLSLGNPVKDIEGRLSFDGIAAMMGNPEETNIRIYDYRPDDSSDVQIYLIHYPITEMNLNLGEYMMDISGETVTIPSFFNNDDLFIGAEDGICLKEGISDMDYSDLMEYVDEQISDSHSNCDCGPFISIPLDDMAKLIFEAKGGPFGIEIDYNADLESVLYVKIPGFGINSYMPGVKVGEKLRFANTGTELMFKPSPRPTGNLNDENELEIFVNIKGACSGDIKPEIVFEWSEAIVKGDTSNLTDNIELDINLTSFLGDGTTFNKVEGYIYIEGVDTAELTLKLGETFLTYGSTSININESLLTDREGPKFPSNMSIIEDEIPPHSLPGPINFTSVINGDAGILSYTIDIPEFKIYSNVAAGKIKADLVIVLPLELKITEEDPIDPSETGYGYVKLDMGLEELLGEGGGDLFGRTGDESDDIFSQLESVDIIIENRNITIFDQSKLAILVKNGEDKHLLDFSSEESPHWEITSEGLAYPFSPAFEVLLKKDNQSHNYATFAVKRMTGGRFDFTLAIKALADLDITIGL